MMDQKKSVGGTSRDFPKNLIGCKRDMKILMGSTEMALNVGQFVEKKVQMCSYGSGKKGLIGGHQMEVNRALGRSIYNSATEDAFPQRDTMQTRTMRSMIYKVDGEGPHYHTLQTMY